MARRSPSLQAFLRRCQALPKKIAKDFDALLEKEVGSMVTGMRLQVRYRTGRLRRSIVYEKQGPMRYRIRAGGDDTTPRSTPTRRGVRRAFKQGLREGMRGHAQPYDYAASEEWGTAKKRGKPFFYSTYRARKKGLYRKLRAEIKRWVKK